MPLPEPSERPSTRQQNHPTIIVVGGGFSGLLTTINLLASAERPRVRLVERGAVLGRGTAYATDSDQHLLNVRPPNMSALADQPDHFTAWLASRSGWTAHGGFVTRGCYGDYLQDLLGQTLRDATAGQLLLDTDEVVDLDPVAGAWQAQTRMGRVLHADAVVLATGLPEPQPLAGIPEDVLRSPRYIANPWRTDLRRAGRRVLMLGSGLTMVDVALSLSNRDRQLWALSRRGLLPRDHAVVDPKPAAPPAHISPRPLLRAVRTASRAGDWRAVIDGYRPYLQGIWQDWPVAERQRFLRHLRPWWDVHRHRMAPAVARDIQKMQDAGDLTVKAGRVESMTLTDEGVTVAWRKRAGADLNYRVVDTVVNCTGGGADLAQIDDPLTARLAQKGLIRADACALGFDVDLACRLIGADGAVTSGLYAVGSMTRGTFGEMTAVPDLRRQAADVAWVVTAHLPPLTVQA